MKNSIFKYDSYKEYLNLTLESLGSGARSKMALAAGCQAGYVTQVLNGDANFSAEHAEKISQFLGHTDSQLHFFLLLVNFERAGTDSLKRYYKKQIEKIKLDQDILKNRMEFQQILSIENQAIFYSSWHYGAIHVAVSIPGCDTEEGLSKYFNIPLQRVSEITSFLENIGLLVRDNLRLKVGPSQVFLGSDSPLISKLHTNWRIESIKSLDRYTEKDLHYSATFTASHDDVALIREYMIDYIKNIRTIIKPSKNEACFAYTFDLFKMGT